MPPLLATLGVPDVSFGISILLLLGGLALLGAGADRLVRGASSLALKLHLTPTVIGLTVVALGTSLPELVVSVAAQIDSLLHPGEGGEQIAWGNVVGSNVFNIGAVLGAGALIRPLAIPGSTVRVEYPFMLLSAILVTLFLRFSPGETPTLDRWESGFLVAIFIAFTAFVIVVARRQVSGTERLALVEAAEESGDLSEFSTTRSVVECVAGTIALAIGGEVLIEGAKSFALHLEVTPRVISTVVVAAATGFPELVTTIVAIWRGKTDLAVANIVGSNIFNTLWVLGVAGLVKPLAVPSDGLDVDLTYWLAISFVLAPAVWPHRLARPPALVLVLIYVFYLAALLER